MKVKMTIAYVFKTSKIEHFPKTMILPQLEENNHGVKVAGMFFFDDKNFRINFYYDQSHSKTKQ